MTRTSKVIVYGLGGMAALVVMALIAGTIWVGSLYDSESSDARRAAAAFAEVRQRYAGVEPAFAVRDGGVTQVRLPRASIDPAATLRILVWDADRQTLDRVTLPLWVASVATEPLPIENLAGMGPGGLAGLVGATRRANELNLRLSDLERYGRTLFLDATLGDGKQVLMWNE